MGNLLLQVGSCNCMNILNVEAVSGNQSILASTQDLQLCLYRLSSVLVYIYVMVLHNL